MNLEQRMVRRFSADHPSEAAHLLAGQPPDSAAALLARLEEEPAAQVLVRLGPLAGPACLAALGPASGAALLARLPAEQAAGLLRRLDPGPRQELLAALPGAERLRPLLAYPEDCAGSLMDPQALALAGHLDLEETRRRIARSSAHLCLELYVLDSEQRLRGVADLRQVLDAARRGPLSALAQPVEALPPRADAGAMAVHPGWNERSSLPVVDEHGVFLGAVRQERLRQALQRTPDARRARGGLEAVMALGELYWLGLSGLFTGLGSSGAPRRREESS